MYCRPLRTSLAQELMDTQNFVKVQPLDDHGEPVGTTDGVN